MDIFAGGKFCENLGRTFHVPTPISFKNAYWFYFHVGVIFAKKTKCENYPHAKIKPTFIFEGNRSSNMKCPANIFTKFPPSENIHVYSMVVRKGRGQGI